MNGPEDSAGNILLRVIMYPLYEIATAEQSTLSHKLLDDVSQLNTALCKASDEYSSGKMI